MRPSKRLLTLSILVLAWAVLGLFLDDTIDLLPLIGGIIALPVVFDFVMVLAMTPPTMNRVTPPLVFCGRTLSIRIELQLLPPWHECLIYDGLGSGMESNDFPLKIGSVLSSRKKQVNIEYLCSSIDRGTLEIDKAWCMYRSFLGLWWRHVRIGERVTLKSYPTPRLGTGKLGTLNGAPDLSSNYSIRRRGTGSEFHQLREYRNGDSPRNLDWKASSRRGKAVVREYQDEQNQDVYCLLDCGYRMYAHDGTTGHFDRAIDSILTLSEAVLRQGDRIGLLAFGTDNRFLAPIKGLSSMPRLVETLHDLNCEPVATNPGAALDQVLSHIKRRSLIILFSNVREEDSEAMAPQLIRVGGRHLLLTIWLREEELEAYINRPDDTLNWAVTAAAARLYLDSRYTMQKRIEAQGINVLECRPDQLSATLVAEYWKIKKSAVL